MLCGFLIASTLTFQQIALFCLQNLTLHLLMLDGRLAHIEAN